MSAHDLRHSRNGLAGTPEMMSYLLISPAAKQTRLLFEFEVVANYIVELPPDEGTRSTIGANFSDKFVRFVSNSTGLSWRVEAESWSRATFGPVELFHYIHVCFFSTEFRQRYANFLYCDFPRVFAPRNGQLFKHLSRLGMRLAALHRLEDVALSQIGCRRSGDEGHMVVARGFPKYCEGKIYKNRDQWFAPVASSTWEYRFGAHQVCRKWLIDRCGRCLNSHETMTYCKMVTAIGETFRIVDKIEHAICESGGWPEAFANRDSEHTGGRTCEQT